MDSYIDKLADVIVDIVDDETLRWPEKRDTIIARCKGDKDFETALREFLSWFDETIDED